MVTRFDGYSHQQLWNMIAALDPGTVESRAAQLTTAAATIKEIGEALKKREVRGWEGEAAQAFHDWAGQAGSATLRLSEYSAAGGEWMSRAGQVMYEVKGAGGVPEYDPATAAHLTANLEAARAFHNDPDAQRIGREAWSKLTGDHQRAIDGLKKLAEAYEHSTQQLNRAEIPTFPPPPETFVPKGVGDVDRVSRPGGDPGTGVVSDRSTYVLTGEPETSLADHAWTPGRQSTPDSAWPPMTGPALVTVSQAPNQDVSVDLDSVEPIPDVLPPLAQGVQVPGVPGRSADGITPGGAIPPLPWPPIGGLVAPGGRADSLPPRDTGIVGGRPVSTGVPSTGIPRGTVVGPEGTQFGARGMGGGPHGGPGGSMPGRRLAVDPGVGGRSATGSQPFTPGGSGLVRGSPGGAAMGNVGPGVNAPGRRQGVHGSERPGYLAEDEETWQGNRRVVPPVID